MLTIVDYSLTLEQMIAAGHYDWWNVDDITPNRFPIIGEGKVEYENKIFPFGHDVSSEEADSLMRTADPKNPWEPWKIEQTLAFGATYPEKQRKYWIVGLGSSCVLGGGRRVPVLGGVDSWRDLHLVGWDGGWSARCRFGAARKRLVA